MGGGGEAAAPLWFFLSKNSKKLKSTQKNSTAFAINKTPINKTLRQILDPKAELEYLKVQKKVQK